MKTIEQVIDQLSAELVLFKEKLETASYNDDRDNQLRYGMKIDIYEKIIKLLSDCLIGPYQPRVDIDKFNLFCKYKTYLSGLSDTDILTGAEILSFEEFCNKQ